MDERPPTKSRHVERQHPGVIDRRHFVGEATARRIGRLTFPVYELAQGDDVLARIGRFGWFRIFFGPGQKVELADGDRWRVRAMGVAGAICPIIVDAAGQKLAIASLGAGGYGINDKDDAYVFYSTDPRRFGGGNHWILRRFEDELAVVTRSPMSVTATRSLPLGIAMLCFVLVRYGIPGESAPRIPAMSWG